MNRLLATALVAIILAGCAGPSSSGSPGAAAPSPSPTATPAVTPAAATPKPSATPTAFPTGAFAALGDDPVPADLAAKFQAALNAMAEVTDGVGFAATVMTPEGTWSGASGTSDGVHAVAVDSQFGIASGTKPIIAAQVMRLVEAGEISLDAPATDYLPPGFEFDTNGATIRQLLSHRSGIPDWYGAVEQQLADDRTRVWEVDEVLALVDPTRLPIDKFEYADTNYNLLGLVIEHVRQRPLVEVLRDDVLRVQGTERLIYQPAEAPTAPIAMPRGEASDALDKGGGYLPSLSDASADGPAGAGASDTRSLARWWRAFCAGEVVSQASLDEMATFYENGEIDYGLGLFNPALRASVRAVGHLGANFGYKSSAGCLTEDSTVFVVLTNGADVDSFGLATPLVMAARTD